MQSPDDLLQPSLGQRDSPTTSIFSARTGYVAAFFGGPLAGATMAMANSYRLRRLRRDWPLGLLGIAATVAPVWWWYRGGRQWVAAHFDDGDLQILMRVLGLVFFALAYRCHRQYYRNVAFFGQSVASDWHIGLAAILLGIASQIGLSAAFS